MKKDALRPKKHLGQNFLKDENIIRKIINACHLTKTDNVLEIGPGFGAITNEIANSVQSLYAVEKDKTLYTHLCDEITAPHVKFLHEDFLTFNFSTIRTPVKVIGNLPYNISSPIIEKLIQNKDKISEIFIMVQKEFAQRLAAKVGTRDYSALTCGVQYYTIPKILFTIKPSSFYPAPKVESAFVHMTFRQTIAPKAADEKFLFTLIKVAFQQRRKQLKNALAPLCADRNTENLLTGLNIAPQARAENLAVADFVTIANTLLKQTL